ncbi:hypothetical protein ACIO13_35015 [Streptomyces sp. NPDC087425]|uniref:hypothetical protein n=1 Tax=Streptomyces sp. NPDC087425 TaxID=3365787 RepID=UPI00382D43F7
MPPDDSLVLRVAGLTNVTAAPRVFTARTEGEAEAHGSRAGLAVLGDAFGWIGLRRAPDGTAQVVHRCAEQTGRRHGNLYPLQDRLPVVTGPDRTPNPPLRQLPWNQKKRADHEDQHAQKQTRGRRRRPRVRARPDRHRLR